MSEKYFSTQKLRDEVALRAARGVRRSSYARKLRLFPGRFSEIVNGSYPVRRGDPRANKLCELLGLRFDEAFENVVDEVPAA